MNKKKILVVEDENIIALEIMKRLISLDYEVEGVVNKGIQAIEFVKNNDVDLILMDIRLQGDIDGIEAAKRINEIKNIPIIYLTAYSDDKTLERAKSTNVYGYVVKPISDNDLKVAVEIGIERFNKDYSVVERTTKPKRDSIQKRVQIWQGSELLHFDPHDIIYLRIESGIVCFYVNDQEYCQRGTLRSWEKKLSDYHFFRSHKSYIVNVLKVKSIKSDGANAYLIEMEGSKEDIPLARNKYATLKDILEI